MGKTFLLRSRGFQQRCLAAVAVATIAALLLAGCNGRQEDANDADKARNERARLVFYYLFGIDETKPNKLARNVVTKFRQSKIYLEQPQEFAASDYELHAKLVRDVFQAVGLSPGECPSSSVQCGSHDQVITLSLQDDAKGTLNQMANYLAFSHGGLDLNADQTKPADTSTPLFQRKLGVTCVGVFSSDTAGGQPTTQVLKASIINIVVGKDRLRCTAEKTLYLLGLYSTPEMSQTATTIANAAAEGRSISRDMFPSEMLSALNFLYADEVTGPLTETEAWRLLRSGE